MDNLKKKIIQGKLFMVLSCNLGSFRFPIFFFFLNKQELSILSKPSGFQRVNGKSDYRPAQLKLYSTSASSMKWKLVIEILFSDCQHWIHSKYLHS